MEEEEAVMSELRRQLEDEGLSPEEQMILLNEALNSECAAEEDGVRGQHGSDFIPFLPQRF